MSHKDQKGKGSGSRFPVEAVEFYYEGQHLATTNPVVIAEMKAAYKAHKERTEADFQSGLDAIHTATLEGFPEFADSCEVLAPSSGKYQAPYNSGSFLVGNVKSVGKEKPVGTGWKPQGFEIRMSTNYPYRNSDSQPHPFDVVPFADDANDEEDMGYNRDDFCVRVSYTPSPGKLQLGEIREDGGTLQEAAFRAVRVLGQIEEGLDLLREDIVNARKALTCKYPVDPTKVLDRER